MSSLLTENPFVWVTVIDPGPSEQYLGLTDETTRLDFIPMFRDKEDALKCYHLMTRDKQHKYEIQAVHLSELRKSATAGGFMLFLLDGDGKVLKKLPPVTQ